MQQAWSTGKQKEVEEQDEPRQEPDRDEAQDPSLLHLPTLSCEQGKVGCWVSTDPAGFIPGNKEKQGINRWKEHSGDKGEGKEDKSAPSSLLAGPDPQQQGDVVEKWGQLLVTEDVEEEICNDQETLGTEHQQSIPYTLVCCLP